MSHTPEISSPFTYTSRQVSPTLSPCGTYIAYIQSTKLIIKKARNLKNFKVFQLKVPARYNNFTRDGGGGSPLVKISQLKWELLDSSDLKARCGKLAIVIDNLNLVQIFELNELSDNVDYEPIVIQESWEGIETFEWIPPCSNASETAYKNSKQILVFSKDNLKCTLYSLDSSQLLEVIDKPKFAKILTKPGSDIWSIVTRNLTTDYLVSYVNADSVSHLLYKVELSGQLDIADICWMKSGKWLFVNDSVLDGFKISFWNLLGLSSEKNKPIFEHETCDSLGLSNFECGIKHGSKEEDILVLSDYENNIIVFDVDNLKFTSNIKVNSLIESEKVKSWKQVYDPVSSLLKFRKQRTPFDVPIIDSSDRLNAIDTLRLNNRSSKLVIKSSIMPETVFIHDIVSGMMLSTCIMNISPIIDVKWHKKFDNLLMIVDEFNITLYCEEWNLPVTISPALKIKEANFISNNATNVISLLVNDHEKFVKITYRLSIEKSKALIIIKETFPVHEAIAVDDTDLVRQGSPILIEDDENTNVREIVIGVQQSEWAQRSALEITDTFVNRRVKDEPAG